MAAPLATLTGMNELENLMDSEAGIIEVVLGTEFLTIAPLATLTGINALEMDSEGRIDKVVLGKKILTMTDEQAIIKVVYSKMKKVQSKLNDNLIFFTKTVVGAQTHASATTLFCVMFS